MRKLILGMLTCICFFSINQVVIAQNMEVDGTARLTVLDMDTISTDIVVRQGDGTLAISDITEVNCPGGREAEGSFYLGKDTLGGIVFHVYTGDDGQQHGLIVSKTENAAVKWQNTAILIGADRTWDGDFNTGLMTDSPAKDWVTANFSAE
ncbi:MAG: hypothetical protein HKN09_03840, partial [Saprospiraceae bacterium]|nr:hypothetical protein [Saprospiraceae bacterium]